MDAINFVNENWPVIVAGGVILDFIAGHLPDKYVPYVGLIKRVVKGMRGK